MAHEDALTTPQPATESGTQDVVLPTPRPPVLDSAAPDIAEPVRRPVRAARGTTKPASGSRAGWVVSIVAAAAAAWAVGWVAGVSWAWREMTPGFLSRTHRKRGAGLGVGRLV